MIRPARELSFSPPPRCPRPGCNVGLLAYGDEEPFAVDAQGRPYCRVHGGAIDPAYPQASAQYREELKARRRAAFRDLDELTLDALGE